MNGMVSVELLNIERGVSDVLREDNNRLREEIAKLKERIAELDLLSGTEAA